MDANTLRSRQMNPCDQLFWKARGYSERPANWKQVLNDMDYYKEKSSNEEYEEECYDDYDEEEYYNYYDNYYDDDEDDDYYDEDEEYYDEDEEEYNESNELKSLQNNPNNIEYWRLRGYDHRPHDWKAIAYGTTSSSQPQQPKPKPKPETDVLPSKTKWWQKEGTKAFGEKYQGYPSVAA